MLFFSWNICRKSMENPRCLGAKLAKSLLFPVDVSLKQSVVGHVGILTTLMAFFPDPSDPFRSSTSAGLPTLRGIVVRLWGCEMPFVDDLYIFIPIKHWLFSRAFFDLCACRHVCVFMCIHVPSKGLPLAGLVGMEGKGGRWLSFLSSFRLSPSCWIVYELLEYGHYHSST